MNNDTSSVSQLDTISVCRTEGTGSIPVQSANLERILIVLIENDYVAGEKLCHGRCVDCNRRFLCYSGCIKTKHARLYTGNVFKDVEIPVLFTSSRLQFEELTNVSNSG